SRFSIAFEMMPPAWKPCAESVRSTPAQCTSSSASGSPAARACATMRSRRATSGVKISASFRLRSGARSMALEEVLRGVHGERVGAHGAADAVGLARGGLGLLQEVEYLLRPQGTPLGVEHDHDAGLQAPHQVLRDHDADLAGVQFDDAADRIDADALDELLDERLVEQLAAQAVQLAERVRRRELLGIRAGRDHRRIAVDDAGDRPVDRNLGAAQAARIAAAVLALVVLEHDFPDLAEKVAAL